MFVLFLGGAVILNGMISTSLAEKVTLDQTSGRAFWEFPGGPVVRTRAFTAEGTGSIPGRGTRILKATRRNQKKKKRAFCQGEVLVEATASAKALRLQSSRNSLEAKLAEAC